MKFSLFYFDGDGLNIQGDPYKLLMESAKFADRNGFSAVWTPERHFHAFGGLYPNPAVTSAALAVATERIQLRAGSVVLPLHHPVRVAEDWAVVDNLSGGRAAIAFASGWTMDEFILSREPHGSRKSVMWRGIDTVQKLWQGEAVEFEDVTNRTVSAKTLPRPVQPKLPTWVTCQSMETFIEAGRLGVNVLTSLLGETLEQVAPKIARYRETLQKNGHEPGDYTVSMMMHTFLGEEVEQVKEEIRQPFCEYLKTHYGLLENLAKGMGLNVSLDDFSDDDLDSLLLFGVEGFMKGRSLIGTPESCMPFVQQLHEADVDEVACLIDFVQDFDAVMKSLPYLATLQAQCNQSTQKELLATVGSS
ncbi:LLM class flavin-dependent oxidoreductase [cf. Phormidesmis sp. LEGE 11477]|uniref:LLM class flavin-dependent oxidoreductase n=1 Tax=cf. Phormidesmis sp. LEGE 11477 TaxID=1828680 RepID=UPI00188019E0|nr:LLM class flavin-dependent oxidoreductase [cf. Phormidesmis sp. LEGE 11477]MBE9060859.1 LLM class flavin-dependent oxidoreductase [cf. Phormidesmis sp. LEGE 11477]